MVIAVLDESARMKVGCEVNCNSQYGRSSKAPSLTLLHCFGRDSGAPTSRRSILRTINAARLGPITLNPKS